MSVAFVVFKLEGGVQIDPPPQGVTGSRISQGGIGLIVNMNESMTKLHEIMHAL